MSPKIFILGPFRFSIGACDMFLLKSSFDIARYADDNTLYISGPNEDCSENRIRIFQHKSFQVVQREPHII